MHNTFFSYSVHDVSGKDDVLRDVTKNNGYVATDPTSPQTGDEVRFHGMKNNYGNIKATLSF